MRRNTSCCATARLSRSLLKPSTCCWRWSKRHGHLLEKDELLKKVWPDTFVEEANLASNISQLRKALGDGENGQRYIETAPKRGYRFVASVKKVEKESTEQTIQEPPGLQSLTRGSVSAADGFYGESTRIQRLSLWREGSSVTSGAPCLPQPYSLWWEQASCISSLDRHSHRR